MSYEPSGWVSNEPVIQIISVTNGFVIRYAAGTAEVSKVRVVESGSDLSGHVLAVLTELKLEGK